jgi:hypothetical protein
MMREHGLGFRRPPAALWGHCFLLHKRQQISCDGVMGKVNKASTQTKRPTHTFVFDKCVSSATIHILFPRCRKSGVSWWWWGGQGEIKWGGDVNKRIEEGWRGERWGEEGRRMLLVRNARKIQEKNSDWRSRSTTYAAWRAPFFVICA